MSSPKGYILTNVVSHTRYIPFRHTFKYTTLSVLVNISALEDNKLDTPLLFGYNNRWRSVCSLSSNGYLFSSKASKLGFREKLNALLQKGGYGDVLDQQLEIWMLTMPSYLGFEGINPLTVYFLYTIAGPSSAHGAGHERKKELKLVLFEVHNTFGEGHVYFMRPGVDEDSSPTHIYDHQWTFPRAFHVSPFNDRKGSYTVLVKLPQFPDPNTSNEGNLKSVISIQLREPIGEEGKPGMSGKTKLTATLRTTNALPLPSARNLLFTLIPYPLELFLSMPRILYQASILHYRKGDTESDLKVYIRPEPFLPPPPFALPSNASAGSEVQIYPATGAGFTIRRRPTGVLGHWAKERVREFLRTRVQRAQPNSRKEDAVFAVVLIEPEPFIDAEEWFLPPTISTITTKKLGNVNDPRMKILRLTPLSPEFFELLLTAPSAGMALFAGGIVDPAHASNETHRTLTESNSYANILNHNRGPNDALFVVNDPELFLDVFNGIFSSASSPTSPSLAQRLRLSALPSSLVTLLRSPRIDSGRERGPKLDKLTRLLSIPETHFLDFPYHSPPPSSSGPPRFPLLSQIQVVLSNISFLSLLIVILTLSALEPRIFALFRARMVSGTETWNAKIWERVEKRIRSAMDRVN